MIKAIDFIESNTPPTSNKDILTLKGVLAEILDNVAKRIECSNVSHNGLDYLHEDLRLACIEVCNLTQILLKEKL